MANYPFINYDIKNLIAEFKQWITDNNINVYEGSSFTLLAEVFSEYLIQTGYIANFVLNESNPSLSKIWNNKAAMVSRLGYLPYRKKSAICNITLELTDNLNKYDTIIAGINNGIIESFSLKDHITINSSPSTIKTQLIQGKWTFYDYIINDDSFEHLIIPDLNIEINSLSVKVYKPQSNNEYEIYHPYEPHFKLSDNFYFVTLDTKGYYNIVFGDNIIGNKPFKGSRIFIEYIKSDGLKGNGFKQFDIKSNNNSPVIILDNDISLGGDDLESEHSINLNLLKNNSIQSITQKYLNLLRKKFLINDLLVIDGDFTNPPQYGLMKIIIPPSLNGKDLLNFLNENKFDTSVLKIEYAKSVKINVKLKTTTNINKNEAELWFSQYSKNKMETINSGFYPNEFISEFTKKFDTKIIKTEYQFLCEISKNTLNTIIEYLPFNQNDIEKVLYENTSLPIINNQVSFNFNNEDFITINTKHDSAFIENQSIWIPSFNTLTLL